MISKLDTISDIATEFGTTLSGKPISWFYANKNPKSPVQPVMGGGKISDWIGYDHNYNNLVTVDLLSNYDSNGKKLTTYTGVIGGTLVTSDNQIVANTGDVDIPVEKGICKYKMIEYADTKIPRVYANQSFSGSIVFASSGLLMFTENNNIVYTNFSPRTIIVKDINNKLLRTEFVITSNGNSNRPNGYIFTNKAEICTVDDISKCFTFTVRFYYKSGISSLLIKNIADTGYTETLNTYSYNGYREGRNWIFRSNTTLEIQ